MPTFADLLTPQAQEKLAAIKRPEVPSFEVLEAERVANLERLSASRHQGYESMVAAMEAQEAEDEAMLPVAVRNARKSQPRETVGAIRKPRTKKRAPRLECSPEELAAADAKRLPPMTEEVTTVPEITLSHLSDAELGRMFRAGLLTLVVDELPEAMAAALGAKADKAADAEALLTQERAERKADPAFLLPGFTVGDLTIAELDLRDKSLGELVPSKVRSPYNKARYRLGIKEVLDAETTCWRELGVAHKQLSALAAKRPTVKVKPGVGEAMTRQPAKAPKVALTVKLDPAEKARKIAALAEVLGISKKAAAKRMKEMSV